MVTSHLKVLISVVALVAATTIGFASAEDPCEGELGAFSTCIRANEEECLEACRVFVDIAESRSTLGIPAVSCSDVQEAVDTGTYIEYCDAINCCPECAGAAVLFATCKVDFVDFATCPVQEICMDAVPAQTPITTSSENDDSAAFKGTYSMTAAVIGSAVAMYAFN